jgi:hypothetical protein
MLRPKFYSNAIGRYAYVLHVLHPILFFLQFFVHRIQIARTKAALQPDSYVVRFADGSTRRYGGFVKDCVTIGQLSNSVVTDQGTTSHGCRSEFREYGPRPRLMCGGVLCDNSALCESFRAGSSSRGGSGGGGVEAAVEADFVFDFAMIRNEDMQTESYVVRFADGSTQRFGGFVKNTVTVGQLAKSVATGKGRIDDNSVFLPFGHQPRLMFVGVLCEDSALCESFRVGSSGSGSGRGSGSSSSGCGGAEAAASADFVFDVVCFPPCVGALCAA